MYFSYFMSMDNFLILMLMKGNSKHLNNFLIKFFADDKFVLLAVIVEVSYLYKSRSFVVSIATKEAA